jgi:hypothetical protein
MNQAKSPNHDVKSDQTVTWGSNEQCPGWSGADLFHEAPSLSEGSQEREAD